MCKLCNHVYPCNHVLSVLKKIYNLNFKEYDETE